MVPESNSRASQAICLFSLCHCLSKSVKFNVESFMRPHANSSVLQDLKGFYRRNAKVYDLLVGFLWLLGKLGFHSWFCHTALDFQLFFFFVFFITELKHLLMHSRRKNIIMQILRDRSDLTAVSPRIKRKGEKFMPLHTVGVCMFTLRDVSGGIFTLIRRESGLFGASSFPE